MNRKGYNSLKNIPVNILNRLNLGVEETKTLSEYLAVDRKVLLESFLNKTNRHKYLKFFNDDIFEMELKAPKLDRLIGEKLLEIKYEYQDENLIDIMKNYKADIVRSWCCYVIGLDKDLGIKRVFEDIKTLACDENFNVREVSWMAVRHYLNSDLDDVVEILKTMSMSQDEYVRRFVCELTRPRGVWTSHIPVLKKNPERCIDILENLKYDKSKYVMDSLANWINDASKTRPDFVINLCSSWSSQIEGSHIEYVIKRGLRSIDKKYGV